MDSYTACSVIEGFASFDPTTEDTLKAWAYLIKSGECWHLQGFYGRGATDMIESGYITKNGRITAAGKELI